jgi:aspartate/methionine/tyrosine aminotransferase
LLFAVVKSFATASLAEAIEHAHVKMGKNKVAVYVNFPNNPTGYNLTPEEGEALRETLSNSLENNPNLNIVVITDEAYFGLSYTGASKQPIMSYLINVHPRLLTIGAKGPTKEVHVWGLRVGALYALPYGMQPEVIQAMNEKLAGTTRGFISMPSVLGQEITERIYASQMYLDNAETIRTVMRRRAEKMKGVLSLPEYQKKMPVFPFNAGYFCCFQATNAERIRQKLLQLGGGVIAGCEYNDITLGGAEFVRFAFSCLTEEKIPEVLEMVLKTL